jgi:hypothetical protein
MPGAQAEVIKATPVTVFVGPNNSGKSKVLAEIEQYCRTGRTSRPALVLQEMQFMGLSATEVDGAIERLIQVVPPNGQTVEPGHVYIGSTYAKLQVRRDHLTELITNPASDIQSFCQVFLTHGTLALNGPNRVKLVSPQPAGDLQASPDSSLQLLFRDDAKRAEVRRIVLEAFNLHFVVDPTNLGQLRIRLSERAPADAIEERGIHREAVRFHEGAQPIHTASDGVKAFTGIIAELVAGDPRVLLVDEPEAFLHPSLAGQLGQEIAKAAARSGKRVFASTHSPSFLMGCIQSGVPVNIVRLTYRAGVATARLLSSDQLLDLMRNPLLRSTGVLTGLFFEFVVITESDADRAFYQEINERLLRHNPDWGIPNCLFINAQNKQTVHTIMKPLRQLGIPAAGVVDVDVLKEGGVVWTNLLTGANIPPLAHGGLANTRAAVRLAMDNTGKDMKRDGGVEILPDREREAALHLLSQLSEYGVFVVKGGELESWVKTLGATGHGSAWLIDVFEKMGANPDTGDYLTPQAGDVWAFIRELRTWMIDAGRRGIPS